MDDLQRQLDRALQPDAVAMPHEYERQAAALSRVASSAQSAPSVIARIDRPASSKLQWRSGFLALAATLALILILSRLTFTPMPRTPGGNSSVVSLPADSLGALRASGGESDAHLHAVALVGAVDDDIPRAFDAPRRGIPLSDSARQLGLE